LSYFYWPFWRQLDCNFMNKKKSETVPYTLVIHGGAGTISKSRQDVTVEREYRKALREALHKGSEVLKKGGSALSAVRMAVRTMEDCPLFNAGKGAVLNFQGGHDLDASIMDGKTLKAGAVANIRNVKNPVELAYIIMKKSKYVMLSGAEALDYALEHGLKIEDSEYFKTEARYRQWLKARGSDHMFLDHDTPVDDKKFGTVGAIARDKRGNLAAATSTGGLVNKRYGRIGDSPIIGAGTYANNQTCAVSCTGKGEFFIRLVVAHEISSMMEHGGKSLAEACDVVFKQRLQTLGGKGGVIALDRNGEVVTLFNTKGMYRGIKQEGERDRVFIFDEN
jgi:L-asparaginase / beta-aspartyl-peptidase